VAIIQRLTLVSAVLLVIGLGAALFSTLRPFGGGSNAARVPVANEVEGSQTDTLITNLQRQMEVRPADPDALAQLGLAYLQKTRETGDPTHYARAEAAFQQSLDGDAQNAESMRGMGSLALARHEFATALSWGEQALQLEPGSARSYGVIGDALIELGRYDEAIDAFQRMVNAKPDLSSFARASYARELTGDVDGAIEAMESAVEAGGLRGENAAWARLQLGHLFFNRGDLDAAERQYESSLDAFPGYVHAGAALARVRAAEGDYDGAVELYREAVERYPVLEYVIALGDVYAVAGDAAGAAQTAELVGAIEQLYRSSGVNSDLELALYYADHDLRLDDALRQARAEYERRPSIHAADVLAWVLYKSGEYEEALSYSEEALRLGTRDAQMLYHAGVIARAVGEEGKGRDYLEQALSINPGFSVLHARDAAEQLAEARSGG
jgi:tetratricopeptide (TPR) repeat protein